MSNEEAILRIIFAFILGFGFGCAVSHKSDKKPSGSVGPLALDLISYKKVSYGYILKLKVLGDQTNLSATIIDGELNIRGSCTGWSDIVTGIGLPRHNKKDYRLLDLIMGIERKIEWKDPKTIKRGIR